MLRRSVLLLLVGCVIHSSAEAFPVGMNEASIHTNTPKNPRFALPDYDAEVRQLALARLEEIYQTPEWEEVENDYQSGKLNDGDLDFIFNEIGHGRSVQEARADLGWSPKAIAGRSKRYVQRAMPGLQKFGRYPVETIEQQAEEWMKQAPGRLEEGSVLKHLGPVGGGLALLAYDLSIGSLLAMTQAGAAIVEDRGTPADVFSVLFIPCVVAFVVTKRAWLNVTTGTVWFFDLIISPAYILHHIAATGMCVAITLFLRWLNKKWKLSRT